MKLFLLALTFGAVAFSQSAKVAILSAEDTAKIKAAYTAMKEAEDKYNNLAARLKRTYIDTNTWGESQFSGDFRAIVPLPQASAVLRPCGGITLTGGLSNVISTDGWSTVLSTDGSGFVTLGQNQ